MILSRTIPKESFVVGAFKAWSYQYLTRKDNRCIVVITAYQPCQQTMVCNGTAKSNTVTAQQISMMLLENDHQTPLQAFVADLDKFVQDIKAEGNRILLIGDFIDRGK